MKTLLMFLWVLLFFFSGSASAATISTFYGDDDGFGIGAYSGTINPTNSNAGIGEAPFTDVRLIGNSGGYSGPAFAPTGNFDPFSISGTIVSATLTIKTGAFDSGPNPVDGPNSIFLDSQLVNSAFINSFSTFDTNDIETNSWALDSSFFPFLVDGFVSLNGTLISEDDGSGSFQIDFLRLDITTTDTAPVPEPATMLLLGSGLVGLLGFRRKLRKK